MSSSLPIFCLVFFVPVHPALDCPYGFLKDLDAFQKFDDGRLHPIDIVIMVGHWPHGFSVSRCGAGSRPFRRK